MKSGKRKTRLICFILTMLLSVCALCACRADAARKIDKFASDVSGVISGIIDDNDSDYRQYLEDMQPKIYSIYY